MSSRAAKWGGQIGLMGRTPPHLSGSPPNPEPWAKGAGRPHSDLNSPRCGMKTIARGPGYAEPREEPSCRCLWHRWNVGFCASAVSREHSFTGARAWAASSRVYPGVRGGLQDVGGSGPLPAWPSHGP